MTGFGFLDKIHLVNIKAHKDLEVDFKNQSTMILGSNGSGKSTIVESIFYLLFRSLLVKNINELINEDIIEYNEEKGTVKYLDKAYVEGWFNHKGKRYHLISGLAKTNCSLEVWNDEEEIWVEKSNKINDIYAFLKEEIFLGMTSEYFINTIYTQQMGILNLVDKTEGVRQKEFDKLINIENFQIIYDALAKPFSELNKMSRDDILELRESLEVAKKRKLECQKVLSEFNEKYETLTREEETIVKKVQNSKSLMDAEELNFKRYDEAYHNGWDALNKIKTYDQILKDKSSALEKLNMDSNIQEIHKQSVEMQRTLSSEYRDLTEKASKIGNTYEKKLNNLESELDKLNEDTKTHEMINFYVKSLQELNLKVPESEKEIKDANEKIDELNSENTNFEKETSELKKEINKIESELSTKYINLKSILKSYENDNFNYKDLERYFNGEIEEYTHIGSDCVCLYCSSKISKEKMQNKIESDKKRYIEISNESVKLESERLKKQEELSLLNEEHNERLNLINKFKTKLDYNLMLKNEMSSKINDVKLNLDNLRSKLIFSNLDSSLIIKKISDVKDDIFKIKNNKCLQTIRPYQNFETNEFSDLMAEDIIPSIQEYERKNENYSNLLNTINEYNQKFSSIKKDYDDILETREVFANNLNKITSEYNVQNVNEIKILAERSQDKLNKLKTDFATIEKDKLHIFEQKQNIVNIINVKKDEEKYTQNDIDKIESILETNKLVQKKLEILNTAKSYFKQDGLAKYIRSFYINKINENMASYVHLFGFDFLPKIDETAGIEKYYKYSGGQKIAIAILMKMVLNFILKNPIKMMILDEPTPYMDHERIEAIKDLVVKIKDVMQILVITHDTEFMTIDCNKVLMS